MVLNSNNKQVINSFNNFSGNCEEIHGGKYDYSKVVFTGTNNKVCIICPEHGEFEQTPYHHIKRKQGCPQCGTKRSAEHNTQFTLEQMEASSKLYNDVGLFRKVEPELYRQISRRFGADTLQRLCSHMTNSRAVKTNVEFQSTLETNYTLLSDYVNAHTKVRLLHTSCGTEYEVRPHNYNSGHRCPNCASTGFDKSSNGLLYYFKVTHRGQVAWKVGITNHSISYRYSKYEHPRISDVYYFEAPGEVCVEFEQSVLQGFKDYLYTGPKLLRSGNTELFSEDILIQLKEKCERISKTLQKDEDW